MSLIMRCQRGFTTVTLMGVMSIGTLLVAGGFAAVNSDISLSRDDQDYKQAYGAAESGLQWYLSALSRNNNYYLSCNEVPDPSPGQDAPVNNAWNGVGTDPRVWRGLPGVADPAYTVELLPAPGYSACVPNDQWSVIDPDGNMRLRVSGRSRGETRTILATLRRRNFIDFIYFTHFETLDPLAYSSSFWRNWASTNCNKFRSQRSGSCTEIQFATDDEILGPLHSNDSIMVCGTATFGRTKKDAIELNEQSPGYVDAGSCDADPDFDGEPHYPSGQLEMPPSNLALTDVVEDAYEFSGRTKIALEGEEMTVTKSNGTQVTMDLPANGVIYVKSPSCTSSYAYSQTYPTSGASNCGDVWVHGEYSGDLTIAADNDVIVDGNLERTSDGLLLGLIANNFVRVYHPITWDYNDDDDDDDDECLNGTGALQDPVIHAAILALNHSFIVDNWYCGAKLGDLTVEGAIAQRYRGPVGTGGGGGTGYLKDYIYNDRLRYREPPYFINPVQSSWRVARQTEQVPAVR